MRPQNSLLSIYFAITLVPALAAFAQRDLLNHRLRHGLQMPGQVAAYGRQARIFENS